MTSLETASPKTGKRVRGNAVQRLAKACSRVMRDNSEELARALFQRAVQGNAPAARLLIKILEKHPSPRCQKKRGLSEKQALAHALASLQRPPGQPRKEP